jgi:hypothetical protein
MRLRMRFPVITGKNKTSCFLFGTCDWFCSSLWYSRGFVTAKDIVPVPISTLPFLHDLSVTVIDSVKVKQNYLMQLLNTIRFLMNQVY